MTSNNTFGVHLRDLRTMKGMSGNKVAQLAGIDRGLYSKIETGQRPPTDEVLSKLASALHIPLEDLKAWALADRVAEAGLQIVNPQKIREFVERMRQANWQYIDTTETTVTFEAKELANKLEELGLGSLLRLNDFQLRPESLETAGKKGATRAIPVYNLTHAALAATPSDAFHWPDSMTPAAQHAFQLTGEGNFGCGYIGGDVILVRLLGTTVPTANRKVVAKVGEEIACYVYREDALGAYLESTEESKPWRTPLDADVELIAEVLALVRTE